MKEKFQSAIQVHQAGNLNDAERLYREILEVLPDNAPALHLLGLVCYQVGDFDTAIELINKSLSLFKYNPDAYNHLGSALKAKGMLEEAVKCFHQAIELNPKFTEAYFNLGNAFITKGMLEEAIDCYTKATEINPNFFAAFHNMGKALRDKGNTAEAVTAYKKALELNPDSADIYDAIGIILQDEGAVDKAVEYFRKAIGLNPDFAGAYGNLGKALQEKGYFDEALTYYQKAVELNSDRVVLSNLYNNMGIVHQEKGKFDEAFVCYENAVTLDPNQAGIYKNIGTLFHDIGNFDGALANYRKALQLNPRDAELYCNLGSVLQDKGQLDEASAFYKKSLELNPGLPEAHWNMSLLLLMCGNLKEGWKGYEWRLLKKGSRPSVFSQPQWDGGSLIGKTLIVSAEQGVGDEIMFASCLPDVISRADMCIVECDKRLVPLFARSFPEIKFVERVNSADVVPEDVRKADMKIALGSLPKFLRTDFSSFKEDGAYLKADTKKLEIWLNRFSELETGLKVGISWRGGSKPSVKLARSTTLEQWTKLFSVPGVCFINLQYGDCAKEFQELKEKTGFIVHDWEDADPLKDLDGFAAQVAALDLVISVDNSTVHMAGALGISTWALLPCACDWRWMLDVEDTPWYKTIRLFRQSRPGDWSAPFSIVAAGLQRYVKTGILPDIEGKKSFKNYFSGVTETE
jgi:tetratricopeptide (TPR) repeat protein